MPCHVTLTLDHVQDVRADGAYGGQLLLASEPLLNLDGALAGHVHINSQVLEGTRQASQLAGDLDRTRRHAGGDSLRDLDTLARVDRPHFGRWSPKMTGIGELVRLMWRGVVPLLQLQDNAMCVYLLLQPRGV